MTKRIKKAEGREALRVVGPDEVQQTVREGPPPTPLWLHFCACNQRAHRNRSLGPGPLNAKSSARSPLEKPKKTAGFAVSGRQDLNLRPLGPEPSALPG